jgi:predicted RNase H-like nuclease (RuvC/YqgF family)
VIDPGVAAALITGGITAAGGGIAWVRSRFKAREAAAVTAVTAAENARDKNEAKFQTKIDQLEREIKLLEQTVDAKDDTIADLRSQRDRLIVTAEIQDRFFRQLPPSRRNPGDNDG